MYGAVFVAVVFGGILLALAIIGSTILMGIRLIKSGISPKDRRSEAEEAKMIQEIYHGLARMESRVDALETIVLERERKES